jgi:hypothetical protein
MVMRHESSGTGCDATPPGGVYRLHAQPKSGSSWVSRVIVSLLTRSCTTMMHAMGCRVLHHEEDARQEPEVSLRFGTFYRTYLTFTPNYKHAGECMHFKNDCASLLGSLSLPCWPLPPCLGTNRAHDRNAPPQTR